MPGYDFVGRVDEDRHIEAKGVDAPGKLAYLKVAVTARVPGVGHNLCDGYLLNDEPTQN